MTMELKKDHLYGIRLSLTENDRDTEKLMSFCIQPTKDSSVPEALDEHCELTGFSAGDYINVVDVKDFGLPPEGLRIVEQKTKEVSTAELLEAFEALNVVWGLIKDSLDINQAAIERGISPYQLNVPSGTVIKARGGTSERGLVKIAKDQWAPFGDPDVEGTQVEISDEFLLLSVLGGDTSFEVVRN